MTDDSPVIAVVIPAYRAEKHIHKVLEEIPDLVHVIVVVDDCSPDQTNTEVQERQQKDPRIFLVHHQTNQGVGGAMQTGYLFALEKGANVIVKMDSDGQMDPRFLIQLIEPILRNEADYVKGNRFLHEKELKKMPWIRRIGNLGLSFMTKLASGYWNIFDPTNGYTAANAEAIKALNFERISKRFFFETSMLLELGLQRMVVKDVFIPAIYGNEQSSLSWSKSFLEFPPKLLVGMLRRILYLYFIRDFTAITVFLIVGLTSVLFGTVWGIYHWWKSAIYGIEASTGTVMVAILPLMMGLQLLLQAVVMDIQNTPDKRTSE